ncbi:hypothetical protein DMUE_5751 [Dictyocoela muelleri]|nr:hypothetical protein DMUE_5751 [Dictyocoela muelleri]
MEFVKSKFHDISNFLIGNEIKYNNTTLKNDQIKINNSTYTLSDIIFYLQNYKNYSDYLSLCKENNYTPINFFDTFSIIDGIEHDLDFYCEDPLLQFDTKDDFSFINSIINNNKKILVTGSLVYKINIGNFYSVFVEHEFKESGFEQVLNAKKCFVKNGINFQLTSTPSEDVVACINCCYKDIPAFLVRFKDEKVSLKGTNVVEMVVKNNLKDVVRKVWGKIFRKLNN